LNKLSSKEGAAAGDEVLADRAQAGDRAAFESLVKKYGPVLFNFAYRFMQDEDAAKDICQEAFLAAYEKIGVFDPERGTLRSWLFKITANLSLNELDRRNRAGSEETKDRVAERLYHRGGGSGRADHGEVAALRGAIEALPPTDRQMILLSYYHDLSYKEISYALSIPIGTVKSRMHHAVESLRVRLDRGL